MQVVFYHKDCNDGTFAAHSVWEKDKGGTLCIPIDYREFKSKTPDEFFEMCFSDKIVMAQISSGFESSYHELMKLSKTRVTAYLVDISVPKEILRRISKEFNKVVVLDHHESANAIYQNDPEFSNELSTNDFDYYTFNKNVRIFMDKIHSGARLAWTYMNPNEKEVPYYIDLVSQYDTWKKKDKNADYFAAGFRVKGHRSFNEISKALKDVNAIIDLGEVIQDDRDNRARAAITRTTSVDLVYQGKTYKLGIVNSNMDLSSIIGNLLVEEDGYDIGAVYVIAEDGNSVGWSIRSKNDFSCLFFAEHHGGGGHAQACGFGSNLTYLVNVLETKKIVLS